ncbi:MAG: DNA repair protein RecN [Bauldia sp.]|uniref:DNA repair protein RecN n=1 Tax=Bauldia sp. TaxID=2575872 RepID=UPI001D7DABBF|nr:DNA repair protein RecN [Bauldia sp.]MCB1495199.1 DNA repair protein RecN [Bauldia sp.]
MLVALSIRDIVLIDRLSVDFAEGMTVLTGETGAGKSILLDALSLALGGRGDSALVRQGAEQGDVTAVFEPEAGHPVWALLDESAIEAEGALVLRRVQTGDGRSRAFVNDNPVSVTLLRRIGAMLVEIHGQHDDRALVDPGVHRDLLDAFGRLEGEAEAVAGACRGAREAEAAAAALRERIAAARAEADYLRASVEELTLLAPRPGEEDELADRRQLLMRAEKVAGDIAEAHDIVLGSASPVPTLASLVRRLERKAPEAAGLLDEPVAALDRALNALEEAGAALEGAAQAADADPRELEQTEERLFALRAAGRKYNVLVADLPALAAEMAAALAALDSGEEELGRLDKAVIAARAGYRKAAAALSRKRRAAAAELDRAVAAELPALKLERAVFSATIETDPERMSEAGLDDVSFTVRTNPGSKPGPLMKVASGGELARFLLALKVALADRGSAPTLVFDEIDTAVGGAVADAIGARLSRLAKGVQVLSVTHAPQVAARSTSHLLVAKAPGKDTDHVLTDVVRLDGAKRREEIARMLAGATITDEARAAAERLILGAA